MGMTKAEAAYQQIRRRIMDGSLAPGSVLEQELLASTLALSTTPVREALRRLEAEQLVTLHAHREVRVAPLSAGELEELYAVRLELDPMAAALAARHATEDDVSLVESVLARTSDDPAGRLTINRALHRGIYAASGNTVLVQILDSLWDRSDRYRMVLIQTGRASEAPSEHAAIVDALRRRDARGLRRLMRDHLQGSRRHIVEIAEIAEEERA